MAHVCLGDVAREIKQKAPVGQKLPTVGLEHLDPGEVKLAHWDEGVETTFTKAFSKGQVLFGRRRAYLRKAAVAPFDGICSGDITVIAPKDNVSPRLLPFIIQNDALFEHASPIRQVPSRQESSGRAFRNLSSSSPASLSKKNLPTYSGPHKKRGLTTGSCLQPATTSSNHNLSRCSGALFVGQPSLIWQSLVISHPSHLVPPLKGIIRNIMEETFPGSKQLKLRKEMLNQRMNTSLKPGLITPVVELFRPGPY